MVFEVFIIISYALIGAGIKYIDQAYDINIFSKNKSKLLAPFIGILMAYLIMIDNWNALILLSIVIAVAITRKIDNIAFTLGILSLIGTLLLFGNFLKINWSIFAVLLLSGIIDEIGNDLSDKNKLKGMFNHFFAYRFMMKVAVFILFIINILPLIYLIAFWVFDLAYTFVEVYSFKILKKKINIQLNRNEI